MHIHTLSAVLSAAVLCGSSHPIKCTHMLLDKRYWTDAFEAARNELSLSRQGWSQSQQLDSFFKPPSGAELFLIDGKPAAYAVVYKSDSTGIASSMMSADDHHARVGKEAAPFKSRRFKTPSELQAASQTMFNQSLSPSRVFTFVRDPLSHFTSGLVELNFRHLGFGNHPVNSSALQAAIQKNQVGAVYVQQLIECFLFQDIEKLRKFINITEVAHIGLQAPAIHHWSVRFVGMLETHETDWKRLNQYLGSTIPYERRKGAHMSSQDPLGFKAAMNSLLDRDKRYLRALCRVLLADYVCLRHLYAMPAVCADMMSQ